MSNMPFETITVDDYRDDYHNADDTNMMLIDVREVDEYAAGHIPGAINLPMSVLEERFAELDADKKLLLVCRTGGRSAMAGEFLAAQGYKSLVNINGGTLGWAERGNPLEK